MLWFRRGADVNFPTESMPYDAYDHKSGSTDTELPIY